MSCLHQHSQLNPIVSRADMLDHNVLASLLFHDLHTSHTTSSSHTTNKRGHTPTINTRLVTHTHTTNRRISTKTKTPPPKTPPLAQVRSKVFEATIECCAPDLIETVMMGKESQPLSDPESDSHTPTRSLHASFSCNQRVRWTGVFFTLLSRKPFGHHVVSGDYMLCNHLKRVFSSDRRVTCSACGNAVRLCITDYRG